MKILYISMSYNINSDGLYNNLVDELLNRNHTITIVRSDINTKKSFKKKLNNFQVLNVKTLNPFEKNIIKKGINQILLNRYLIKSIKKNLSNESYDLILYATPPVTLEKVITYCKNKYNAKTFLMLKDIFPQNAIDLEMFEENGVIHKYFLKKERKYYLISDYIGCMSQGNINYLIKHNKYLDPSKIHVFPNSIRVDKEINSNFNNEKTVFLFGGNMGKPQNINFLIKVIDQLRDYSKAKFLFIGKGTEQDIIEKYLVNNENKNISFYSFLSQTEYENKLFNCDVGLISLDHRFTIPNIPSKLQTYLKLKKPVLAITDSHTDLREIIEEGRIGWWVESDNLKKVVFKIKEICENKKDQITYGNNGYDFLINNYNVEINVDKIERFMEDGK